VTFSGKIRVYLILVALLPPLLVMSVIYYRSAEQSGSAAQVEAQAAMERFSQFEGALSEGLARTVERISQSSHMRQTVAQLRSGRLNQVDLSGVRTGIDFLELLDGNLAVKASSHRPGLVGERIQPALNLKPPSGTLALQTTEYDISGPHAAYAYLAPVEADLFVYAGRYLSDNYREMMAQITGARVNVLFADSNTSDIENLTIGRLYTRNDTLISVLSGGEASGFYVVASFEQSRATPLFQSLLEATAIVALVSVLIAVTLGMFLTNRAKREIDNLVSATSRVAEGDFSTPVMAYEEGEFSQLADSFSEMMAKLKTVQAKLGTTEKIAAWQAMGRKIAHEVRNPLTPIAISIDDLRQSHLEKQPDFERILLDTTATVKTEDARLNTMLDQFVSFARMQPPSIAEVTVDTILQKVSALYAHDTETGRLMVSNRSRRGTINLDSDLIRQVLINLTKNAFEAEGVHSVKVEVFDYRDGLAVTVEDDGSGFPREVLDAGLQPYLSKKKDGSGLGLVICQRIVFDHGGTIELMNKDEGGARVLVTLPV
jgi:two-component system nitrogen regulation sensor histidine kinase NtrY